MALFSWVPIFVDWAKIAHSWGSKFVVIAFSFIIHTENRFFVGTRFPGSDPPRNHKNWYPTKIKPSTVFNTVLSKELWQGKSESHFRRIHPLKFTLTSCLSVMKHCKREIYNTDKWKFSRVSNFAILWSKVVSLFSRVQFFQPMSI